VLEPFLRQPGKHIELWLSERRAIGARDRSEDVPALDVLALLRPNSRGSAPTTGNTEILPDADLQRDAPPESARCSCSRKPTVRDPPWRDAQDGYLGGMNFSAALRRIQGDVGEKTTPAERGVWYGYVVLIVVLPPLALILLFAGGHGSRTGIGLLVLTLVLYATPMSAILKARIRRREARERKP
jgi:hypothetical protein